MRLMFCNRGKQMNSTKRCTGGAACYNWCLLLHGQPALRGDRLTGAGCKQKFPWPLIAHAWTTAMSAAPLKKRPPKYAGRLSLPNQNLSHAATSSLRASPSPGAWPATT